MENLYSFLTKKSDESDFKAELSKRGGYITFSNSGRRGGSKSFHIGLDSILTTLKDILSNISSFESCGTYDETTWRNNGSIFFTDPVANANSTVQTKPLFSTLSKVIIWANQPNLNSVNSDNTINLSIDCLNIAITKVDELCNLFTPRKKYNEPINNHAQNSQKHNSYLTAIRTKPFLLLAGISGTGKSRIVRELAFKSCPSYLQDNDKTTPGNYCMIEVKPNWHDSTELIGYYSNLSGGYQFKKFVQFLVKAKMYPDVPFFVCLDEMNLAPVEQYFAEVLSVLETRKSVDNTDGKVIKTGVIVEAQHFQQLGKITGLVKIAGTDYNPNFTDRDIYMKLCSLDKTEGIKDEVGNKKELTTEGLTLPHNVIIIGTVNMDDTTHQFSRKVIDRAMTIEMNGGNLKDMFGGSKDLEYLDEEKQQEWQRAFRQNYVTADEVLEAHPTDEAQIVETLPTKLEEINKALKGTPFEVSYRVLNELTIMVGVMLDEKKEGEAFEEIVNRAIDAILLMKILPRIEGDSDMFNLKNSVMVKGVTCNNRLEWLRELAPSLNQEEDAAHQQTAKEKIEEMIERLENQEFTRFWP